MRKLSTNPIQSDSHFEFLEVLWKHRRHVHSTQFGGCSNRFNVGQQARFQTLRLQSKLSCKYMKRTAVKLIAKFFQNVWRLAVVSQIMEAFTDWISTTEPCENFVLKLEQFELCDAEFFNHIARVCFSTSF